LKAFSTHLTSIIKLPNHVAAHYDFTEWSRWRNGWGDQNAFRDP
jgi:hypothetical protein